jgi:hypothetical protein
MAFFNGSTDYVDFGYSTIQDVAAVTVSAWVNLVAYNASYGVVANRTDSTHGKDWQLYIKSSGKIAVYTTSTIADGTGTAVVSLNTWTHIAFSFDTTNGLLIYVNGVLDSTTASGGPLGWTAPTQIQWIGYDNNPGRFLNGYISQVAQWGTTLSATEIKALAAGFVPLKVRPDSLIGYYPLQGSQFLPDQAPNGSGLPLIPNGAPQPANDPPFLVPSRYTLFGPSPYGIDYLPAEGEWPALLLPPAPLPLMGQIWLA